MFSPCEEWLPFCLVIRQSQRVHQHFIPIWSPNSFLLPSLSFFPHGNDYLPLLFQLLCYNGQENNNCNFYYNYQKKYNNYYYIGLENYDIVFYHGLANYNSCYNGKENYTNYDNGKENYNLETTARIGKGVGVLEVSFFSQSLPSLSFSLHLEGRGSSKPISHSLSKSLFGWKEQSVLTVAPK